MKAIIVNSEQEYIPQSSVSLEELMANEGDEQQEQQQPFRGVLRYFLFGKKKLSGGVRWMANFAILMGILIAFVSDSTGKNQTFSKIFSSIVAANTNCTDGKWPNLPRTNPQSMCLLRGELYTEKGIRDHQPALYVPCMLKSLNAEPTFIVKQAAYSFQRQNDKQKHWNVSGRLQLLLTHPKDKLDTHGVEDRVASCLPQEPQAFLENIHLYDRCVQFGKEVYFKNMNVTCV